MGEEGAEKAKNQVILHRNTRTKIILKKICQKMTQNDLQGLVY